jgi:ABC-type multidrug transport system fused ATPase/permease subunit
VTKLRDLLATDPSVPESPRAYPLPPVGGMVVFEHVRFGYDPVLPVLRDVDLHIAAGETVAFVGATGAASRPSPCTSPGSMTQARGGC